MVCIYCNKEIADEAKYCPHCGGNQEIVEGRPESEYGMYFKPLRLWAIVVGLSFFFFSWTNDTFTISKWKSEAIFWFCLIGICISYFCWSLYKDLLADYIKKDEEWRRLYKVKYMRDLLLGINAEGGITTVFKEYIDELDYPVLKVGDTWVILKGSETLHIKLEKKSRHSISVSLYGTINGESVECCKTYSYYGAFDDGYSATNKYNIEKIKKDISNLYENT